MAHLQSINEFSKNDVQKLVDSVDYVFFDIDGVLIHDKSLLPGSPEGVAKFRQLEKKIGFVSNNTVYPVDVIAENIKPFNAVEDEIVVPNESLLAYLKKINFKKDIYVISCSLVKQQLREAGYNIIEFKDICSCELEENLQALREFSIKTLEVCKNVGAVYVDVDFNFCLGSAQAAHIILKQMKDVIFISGLTDDTINLNKEMKLCGPQFYIDGLERWTKRTSVTTGKPGLPLKDILQSKFNISDDSRVLFIGDNVFTDIAFGVKCGYKTCLVLSGVTSKDQVVEWKFPENFKPTYVVPSLGDLYEKIKDL